MPVVPVAHNDVGIAEVTGAKLQAADFGSGAEQIGAGLQQLGRGGSELADTEQEARLHFANATAKDADNQHALFQADKGYNGPDAFFHLSGKDAVLAAPDFLKSLDDNAKELRAKLKDPFAQRLFDQNYAERQAQVHEAVGNHVDAETTQYDVHQTQARVDIAYNAASNASLTDPVESDRQLATAASETEHFAKTQGWSPEQTTAAIQKGESATRHDIGVNYVNSGANGPQVAQAYLDKYSNQFTADDRASLQTHIRTMENAQAAEQRRVEADARRQASEDKRAAGDRAADAARIIETGTPLPAAQVAAALTDAKTADRPGLEFSIKQGAFKNNLNIQYRGSTPAEIQDRLNQLGPKIAAAGDHADVKDVTEFQHLTTIKTQSVSDLAHDPLSWGADHLGIAVPPLDWNNRASINQRVAAAGTVSGRTGAQIKVLTDEEAASLAPTLASGSMADKRTLIAKLSSFGAMGPLAASQVAPGNNQFISLIGLANGASKTASAAHVEWVLSGNEVLKANPKLIKADEADRTFQTRTGGALELLPALQSGVLANAKAIAAARANAEGKTSWGDISGTFHTSISDALGGYMDHGVLRGGLGVHQGRQTLMPDGWSQQDFDTALARTPAAKWNSALNGAAVDASGHVLTIGQVRSLQFVAVGDGRYRVTDGSHYVGKKGGGFLEVDIRKMR
jgi:hypothetical protein